MKEIPLTQGKFALVDDEDYEMLMQWKWQYATGYATRRVWPKVRLLMHRVIMNAQPGEQIDHKNLNRLDNQRSNLRFATYAQNMYNRRKNNSTYSSRYKGVSWYSRDKKWRSQIQFAGKLHCIGKFQSELEAALAYDEAARKHHGEFANTNFPALDVISPQRTQD